MRVTTLARRLGTAALVLTISAGISSCSDDGGSADTSSSASDKGTDAGADEPAADEGVGAGDEGSGSTEASLAELSADDFYSSVMSALREAETFTFESVSGAAGQSQAMSGQARFGDGGIEMKASSTGAQNIELILLGQAMYLKSPDLGTGDLLRALGVEP